MSMKRGVFLIPILLSAYGKGELPWWNKNANIPRGKDEVESEGNLF
jgi:hypothetical protein